MEGRLLRLAADNAIIGDVGGLGPDGAAEVVKAGARKGHDLDGRDDWCRRRNSMRFAAAGLRPRAPSASVRRVVSARTDKSGRASGRGPGRAKEDCRDECRVQMNSTSAFCFPIRNLKALIFQIKERPCVP